MENDAKDYIINNPKVYLLAPDVFLSLGKDNKMYYVDGYDDSITELERENVKEIFYFLSKWLGRDDEREDTTNKDIKEIQTMVKELYDNMKEEDDEDDEDEDDEDEGNAENNICYYRNIDFNDMYDMIRDIQSTVNTLYYY